MARHLPSGIDPADRRVLRYVMAHGTPVKPVRWTIPRRPLGAHMSIAGGMDLAIERGVAIGCTAIQIFNKSNNQWAARPLGDAEVERFRAARTRAGIDPVVAHDSYLINLCSPRSEEHTSELQSRLHLVCRLLLEKKKK